MDDALLVKKAGACNICPKNTACDGQLFPDYAKKKICLDPKCFKEKTKTFEQNKLDENLEKAIEEDLVLVSGRRWSDGTKKVKGVEKEVIGYGRWEKCAKNTPGAKKAVLTSSLNEGEKGKQIYVKLKRKESSSGSSDNESHAKTLERERLLEQKVEKVNKIRTRMFEEICKKPSKLDGGDRRKFIKFVGDRREFIKFVIENLNYDHQLCLQAIEIPRNEDKTIEYLSKLKFDDAIKTMILMALSDDVELGSYNINKHKSKQDSLFSNAKRLKVDISAIEKEFEKAEKEVAATVSKKKK